MGFALGVIMRITAVLASTFLAAAYAQNWPSFRGPGATGVLDSRHSAPVSWDVGASRNVAWRTVIPGLGHSSPIVWGDRIFVTTAVSSDPKSVFQYPLVGDLDRRSDLARHQFKLYCLDKRTGKIIWESVASESVPRVARHPHNSYASSTPATDGKRLVAFFGSEGLYAFDLDGKLLWKQDVGPLDQGAFDLPDYKWGSASSPIIYKNLVIVQCDQQKGSFLAAFDVSTGKPVWRTPREALPSWSTPTVYEGADGAELVANGTEYFRGYDPASGSEIWRIKGTSMISVPTPFAAHGLIYLASGYYRFIQPIVALKPGATGDVQPERVAWRTEKGAPYLPTPIVYGDYFYVFNHRGILTVYNARTGERIYEQRLAPGAFSSSPVAMGGRLYAASEDGDVYVVKAGPTFELLATNKMDEVVMATPALTDGMLIVRGLNHLFGIAE
jgi:outer membrane protein assembly factor BamB